VLLRLLDWLCARWLRRYEGDLPVVTRATVINAATVKPVPTQGREADVPAHLKVGSLTPLADALSKPIVLPDVPKQTVTIAGEWDPNNISVSAEASVDIGKPGGWSTGGKGGYWKDKGAAVMGWLQWKGKR
jgi:hypothetical protein